MRGDEKKPAHTDPERTYTLQLLHPHTLTLDIAGNFHRGLMLGVLLGFVLGVGVVVGAAFLLRSALPLLR